MDLGTCEELIVDLFDDLDRECQFGEDRESG